MRSQLALRNSREETSSAQHAFCLLCRLIRHVSRDTLMSSKFLQNVYLESSQRKNSAALPVLLTFDNGLLKNQIADIAYIAYSRYRLYFRLCFWCWLWESLPSSNKDNPQSNLVSLNLTVAALAELDLRGWVRSPCETRGVLLPLLRGKDAADPAVACFSGVCRTSADLQMFKYVQPVYIQIENSTKRLQIYLS